MTALLNTLIQRSLIETNIYKLNPISCCYYFTISSNYCEVEVIDFSNKINFFESDLKLSLTLDNIDLTELNMKLGDDQYEPHRNKLYHLTPNRKTAILSEAYFFYKSDLPNWGMSTIRRLEKNTWINVKYGKVKKVKVNTNTLEFAYLPTLTFIDLLNLIHI